MALLKRNGPDQWPLKRFFKFTLFIRLFFSLFTFMKTNAILSFIKRLFFPWIFSTRLNQEHTFTGHAS